mgnify:CR=1 FL=1
MPMPMNNKNKINLFILFFIIFILLELFNYFYFKNNIKQLSYTIADFV